MEVKEGGGWKGEEGGRTARSWKPCGKGGMERELKKGTAEKERGI